MMKNFYELNYGTNHYINRHINPRINLPIIQTYFSPRFVGICKNPARKNHAPIVWTSKPPSDSKASARFQVQSETKTYASDHTGKYNALLPEQIL